MAGPSFAGRVQRVVGTRDNDPKLIGFDKSPGPLGADRLVLALVGKQ